MHQQSQRSLRGFVLGVCTIALSIGIGLSAAHAQDKKRVAAVSPALATAPASAPQTQVAARAPRTTLPYYVDFRARTAASYGHAFIWYGRTGQRTVNVAGLHPATDSIIPYMIGHLLPVPSETGASYGDLDEEYLLASYRVYLTDAQAKVIFDYIKRKQANSPLWNAATYNCVMFISDVAREMGLTVPGSHLLYPDEWVKELAAMNHFRKTANMPSIQ